MKSADIGRLVLRYIVPVLLVAGAGVIAYALILTPPTAQKSGRQARTPLVGVIEVQPGNVSVFVEVFGTVVAAREVQIQPEVSGRITTLHPELVPGGLILKGEQLFEIDPSDYKIAVAQADAKRNVAALRIESLRAAVQAQSKDAEQLEAELKHLKWNANRLTRLSESKIAGEVEMRDAQSRVAAQEAALAALRARVVEQEKGVASAVAELAAAESELAAAQLALERTKVAAPFDAIVTDESVELGQLVGQQNTVATLVATGEFWVEAAVPIARLSDIRFASAGGASGGSEPEPNVTVTLAGGMDTAQRVVRKGYALRPLAELDPQGRMARVLVAIRDPLDLRGDKQAGVRSLLLGSYVRLEITAGILENVYAIPRLAMRENDRVWVRDAEGNLRIRDVRIVWRRTDDVLVRDGFEAGDLVVTTRLSSVIPGMPLAIRAASPPERNEGDAGDPGLVSNP